MFRVLGITSAIALAAALGLPATPAEALTMKECGAKYQTAKEANKLNGMKWNDFRKAECADDDASEADAAAAEKEEAKPAPTATKQTTTEKPSAAPAAKPKAAAAGGFPTEVSAKYANETPGKARMHTCLDQYRANKDSGAQQAKWIEKGGGYYSQCNAKLKAGA